MQAGHGGGGARRPLDAAVELDALEALLAGPCSIDELVAVRLRAATLRREAAAAGDSEQERRSAGAFDRAGALIDGLAGPYDDVLETAL